MYIVILINFKIFFYFIFKTFSYNKVIKISRHLISNRSFKGNISNERAFKINKTFRNFPLKSSCLHNSLCEKIMLSYIGIYVDINAGLKNSGNGLEGHAWLTYKDKLISDTKENIEKYQYNHRIE